MTAAERHHEFEPDGPSLALDFSPFDELIYEEDVLEFASRIGQTQNIIDQQPPTFRTENLFPVALAALPGLVLLIIGSANGGAALRIVGGALLIGAVVLGVILLRKQAVSDDEMLDYSFRLNNFSEANGLSYFAIQDVPQQNGALFSLGQIDQQTKNVVRWPGAELEVGEYHFATRNRRNKLNASWWWYARIQLKSDLPELLLETNANKGFLGLGKLRPADKTRIQTKLWASGAEKFTLYTNKQQSVAAQELADQRLLNLLTRLFADLEIIGNHALLYSQEPLGALDPSDWIGLVEITRLLRVRSNR